MEKLYRRVEHPKDESWSHEDNPDWIFVEDWNDGPYFLVEVEPDHYIEQMMSDVLAGPRTKPVDPDKPRRHDWDGTMLKRWAVYRVEVTDE
jgi:hypothetical protein